VAIGAVITAQVNLFLAAPLVWSVEKLNWLMIHAVDPFARLSAASIRLPHYSGWMACVYALYYVPLLLLVVAGGGWNPISFAGSGARRACSRRVVPIALAALAALFAVIVIHPFSAARPDGKLHVDFLDVGQGDSALLTTPDGTTLLIDGGGHPNIDWTQDDE